MIEMPKELKMWKVDALVPYEKNSRKHSFNSLNNGLRQF